MTRMVLAAALAALAVEYGDSAVKESGQPRLADPSEAYPRIKEIGAGGQPKAAPTPAATKVLWDGVPRSTRSTGANPHGPDSPGTCPWPGRG